MKKLIIVNILNFVNLVSQLRKTRTVDEPRTQNRLNQPSYVDLLKVMHISRL